MSESIATPTPTSQRQAYEQRLIADGLGDHAEKHVDLATFYLFGTVRAPHGPTYDTLDSEVRNKMRLAVLDARALIADIFAEAIVRRASDDPAEDAVYRALAGSGVPQQLHDGLVRYFVHHIQPGSFLVSVLSLDIIAAARRADPQCMAALGRIVHWLCTHAPARSWNCAENVEHWLAKREQNAEAGS